MTTTTDEAALLRAIAAHPDEDMPRLMYADLIEDDQPERAEFIRLQIALSHTPDADASGRESSLWHGGVGDQFVTGDVHASCDPSPDFAQRHPVLVVSRGFAETLYLPTLDDLCEREHRECVQCRGYGHIWQMPPIEPIFAIGSREDIRPLPEPVRIQCEVCRGTRYTICDYTGKPTALALDTIRAHPTITLVVVGDRRPGRLSRRWLWHNANHPLSDQSGRRDLLPQPIHELLEGHKQGRHRPIFRLVKSYSTEQAAFDALAVAAGQWLRREAGI